MIRRPSLVPWALVGPVLLVFVAFFATLVIAFVGGVTFALFTDPEGHEVGVVKADQSSS